MVQRATSRPTPRPGIEVVVLARRQLELVDPLFHVQEVVALAAGGRCGADSPGRQLETLQLGGGGAQLHGADAGHAGASPRRVRARVELAVERLR